MRWLIAILAALLILLQVRLWFGEGSLAQRHHLKREVERQRQEIEHLAERNRLLANDVEDLKSGTEAIEERARTDLGMTGKDETFYMVVEKPEKGNSENGESEPREPTPRAPTVKVQ